MGKLRNGSTAGGVLSSTEPHRRSKQSKQILAAVSMIGKRARDRLPSTRPTEFYGGSLDDKLMLEAHVEALPEHWEGMVEFTLTSRRFSRVAGFSAG